MNEPGQLFVLLLNVTFGLTVAAELFPRLWTLWQFRGAHNGLLAIRVVTATKSTTLLVFAIWQALVRIDAVWFSRDLFGPYLERWKVDGLVWALVSVGGGLVAGLYWRTIRPKLP